MKECTGNDQYFLSKL